MRAIQPAPHALCIAQPKAIQSAPQRKPNRGQRRRQRRNRRIIIGVSAAIAGVMFAAPMDKPVIAEFTPADTTPPSSQVGEPLQSSTITPEVTMDYLTFNDYMEQAPSLLPSLDMDYNTQLEIYMAACRCDPELFAAVMAIGTTESGLNPKAIGDGGNSIGMMQINTHWQEDRINRLGITDLTDPVQNALVAVDYIDWITERLDTTDPYYHNDLYMAYNMGWKGYRNATSAGYTSTEYSRDTLTTYWAYLREIQNGGVTE